MVKTRHKRLLILVSFLLVTLSVNMCNQYDASAATWHQGTPREIRGIYQNKTSNFMGSYYTYDIRHSTFTIYDPYLSVYIVDHMFYSKLKTHVYRIKGHRQRHGSTLPGWDDFVVYRKGKYIMRVSTSEYNHQKMRAFKNHKNFLKLIKHSKHGTHF